MSYSVLSRRDMLRLTLGGFGYTALAGLTAQAAPRVPHFPAKAQRVILLYMQGGVSHVDTFDYKPQLQADHGKAMATGKAAKLLASPWKFKQHGESGQWISELFPRLARSADDLCVLTAMHTEAQAHETAVPMFHTGNALQARPSLGAWVLYGLGAETENLPGFIAMNSLNRFGGNNQGSAFLPASYQATFVRPGGKAGGEPVANLRPAHLNSEQQRLQLAYLQRLNERRLLKDETNHDLEAFIGSYEMGFKMQSAVPELMDLSRETADTLKSYGIGAGNTDSFGRQCLYARKFAEAGVRFIEIGTGGWDHHKDLKDEMEQSAAAVDGPIAALLADLKQRDMLKDTLIVFAGEFGRTPFAQFDNGRDHNNRAFTVWLAGGGTKPGHRHGVSDHYGGEGLEGRVHIHDLHATILHQLGLDHEKLTYRYSGRDFRLTDVHGNVVKDILI
ncbi:hypothetical protein ETAA8_03650 [Anatilimnocola aggregata]|uniref:DUF1501 domain-containing protein n=1 Tax=Anatilimnocola aggregata TaxID=2528021 RepID=A0A517Y4Y0_9BACT|nr:DUF1501 domain-containing protein [Anatilimnocola aggregata]QDU25301.1 hypothetical protein ETAA8_03650 [Anatilimnocola aggregata]